MKLPELLNSDEASRYIGYRGSTLRQWRYLGQGPKYIRVNGRSIRYRREDLDEWMDAQPRHQGTHEYQLQTGEK